MFPQIRVLLSLSLLRRFSFFLFESVFLTPFLPLSGIRIQTITLWIHEKEEVGIGCFFVRRVPSLAIYSHGHSVPIGFLDSSVFLCCSFHPFNFVHTPFSTYLLYLHDLGWVLDPRTGPSTPFGSSRFWFVSWKLPFATRHSFSTHAISCCHYYDYYSE